MRRSSVKKNFLLNSAYQLLLVLTPIITTPVLSRTIGAEGNGLFSTTQSVTNYFVLFAMLGMSNYGVRTIAECGEDRKTRSSTFWNLYFMQLAVAGVSFICFCVYVTLFGRAELAVWAAWGMWVLSAVLDVSWLLFGCEEFAIPTVRGFVTRLCSVACIILFVHGPDDVWIYVAAIAGAFLANAVLLWPYVRRYVDWSRPSFQNALKHLVPNLRLFVPVIAISLYTLLDKVMLGTIAGLVAAGYFDYSEKLSKMPMSVITALGAVVLPKMSDIISSGQIEEGKRLVGLTMWFMQICAMALSFGIAAITPEFVPVFFGEGYEPCIPIMRILCLIIPLVCATNVIGVQYMLPTHRDSAFTVSTLAGAAMNIVVNLALIPRIGAMGAAIATVAAELTVLVVQVFVVWKELPVLRYVLDTAPFAVIGLIMMRVIRMLSSRLVLLLGVSPLLLIVEVVCGAICFTILVAAFLLCTKDARLLQIVSSKSGKGRFGGSSTGKEG